MDFGLMNETSENNHNNFKFFFHLCPLSFLIENSYHRKYHKIFLKSFPPVSLYDIAGNNHTKYIQAKIASFFAGLRTQSAVCYNSHILSEFCFARF